jgi:hypothetical protein
MNFTRSGRPAATWCWRASRSAAPTDTDPPLVSSTRERDGGSQASRSRSTSASRSSVAKGGTRYVFRSSARATASATSRRPWPTFATIAPPAASRMRRPSGSTSHAPSARATGSAAPPGMKGNAATRVGSESVDAVGSGTRAMIREAREGPA